MLFEPFALRQVQLANRLVMSPLTRSRAVQDNTANALMATYYGQRSEAGLIITEGVRLPDPAAGYPSSIPTLAGDDVLTGWRSRLPRVYCGGNP